MAFGGVFQTRKYFVMAFARFFLSFTLMAKATAVVVVAQR